MPIKKYDKPNKTIQCIRMLKILKAKSYVKKKEIAHLLGEETTRNINNYKNTLYDAGYPIGYQSGKYGGYYLEVDTMLPGSHPTKEQLSALKDSYDYLIRESTIPHRQILLDVLGSLFLENMPVSKQENLALYGHFPLSMTLEEIQDRYYLLQTAIDSRRKVRILYKGYTKDQEHIVDPYKLYKYSNWILFAIDEEGKNKSKPRFTSFKLHRMLKIDLLEDAYIPDPTFRKEDYFDNQGVKGEIIHLKLRIYGKIGRMLDEKIYGENQQITCQDDKKHIYLFEADMRDGMVVRKFIYSFGPACEVLEPLKIRQEMKDQVRKTYMHYRH